MKIKNRRTEENKQWNQNLVLQKDKKIGKPLVRLAKKGFRLLDSRMKEGTLLFLEEQEGL